MSGAASKEVAQVARWSPCRMVSVGPQKPPTQLGFPARLFAWPQVEGGGNLRLNVLISEENC